jgi:hypothetical protein
MIHSEDGNTYVSDPMPEDSATHRVAYKLYAKRASEAEDARINSER